ncbi:MAG: S-layer homology domain-containing protein, partial [Bacillota bacterium]|nr:S-layer homology domain-containing protein [Bacillota bacterium]
MASAATTALASPFADVPADHWAYDSVAQLAAAGLIEGYPDGTYGGARMMTRYEAAMVFARALNRLESQIAANNLLPELDRVKAELMAEIEAQLAAAGKPVVETRVVETVQKELDEEAVARLRAVEIATDALEGDMAYLEARMLGLIDGIRYDLNKLEETEAVVVEQPSMDEIEALIAQRIQESLVDVASGVKETTIVERVVSTTPELTRDDVELIAEALIKRQIEQVNQEIQVNRELIVGLVDWVDEIDADVAVLKDDVEGLKTSVATLEKSPVLSGELALKGEYKSGDEYAFSQTGNLNLNVKASDTTKVRAFIDWELTPFTWNQTLKNYGVEVTSETPVSRVLVGRIAAANLAPFSNYVLPNANLGFGGVAKVNIIDDLTLDVLGAQREAGDQRVLAALALTYEFMPELGIKLTGLADKPEGAMFDQYAAGVGLFGKVAGIKYTGDFAMDFTE